MANLFGNIQRSAGMVEDTDDEELQKKIPLIQSAFRELQPICVPLTKTPTVSNMKKLQECVARLPREAVEEMQEYIMFPMRFLLKQNANLGEEMSIHTIKCLRIVFEKSEVSRWQTFIDVLTTLCGMLGPPQAQGQVASVCEELKMELVLCIKQLMLAASTSVLSSVYKMEFLPMFGHCVSILLVVVQHEKHRDLCVQAMKALQATAHVHSKVGSSIRQAIGDVFASFLPGILMALTKVVTGDTKQGHKIITTALTLWHEITTLVLGTKNLPDTTPSSTSTSTPRSDQQQRLASLSVTRNETWVKATAEKVAILVKKVCEAGKTSGNWRVRLGLVAWAAALLEHCDKSLEGESQSALLEVLVGQVGDEHPSVAGAAHSALRGQRPAEGLLLENLYALCTAMPRLVRAQDDAAVLSSVRTLHGYARVLGGRGVGVVLRSSPHASRLSRALLHLLTPDASQIAVLQERTLGSPYSDLNSSEWQERPKKYFRYFHDPAIYTEVVNLCQLLGYYGDLEVVLDPFLSEFEQTTVNRIQAALVINNVLLGVIKDETTVDMKTQQKRDTEYMETLVRSLVDMYLSSEYINLPTSNQSESLIQTSNPNKAFDWEIVAKGNERAGLRVEHYNSNILQISALLEGIGGFAKVLGEQFQYLLMDVLYPVLEKLGDENAMVSQSAYLTLRDIAAACNYRSIGELLQENADYLVGGISLRLRHLASHPRAPTVLRVVVTYCGGPQILQHLHHTLNEVLASLDHHYGNNAVQFMRVLNALVKSIAKWYPTKYSIISTDHGLKAVQNAHPKAVLDKNSTTSTEDSSTQNFSTQNFSTQNTSTQNFSTQNTSTQDFSTQNSSTQDSSTQNTSTQNTSTQINSTQNSQNLPTSSSKTQTLADFLSNLHKTHMESEMFDMEGDSGMGSGLESDPDATAEPEDSDLGTTEEEKKPAPVHVQMVTEVMTRCCHLLSCGDPRLRLLVLDTIAGCAGALADSTDQFLPLVHQVWPGFVQRFTDQEPLVTIKACEVLAVLATTSEDFIRQRVVKDILPKLNDYLLKQARISERAGAGYVRSVAWRLQRVVLGRTGELCKGTGLQDAPLNRAVSAAVPYLSARQPQSLQTACLDTFKHFISADPDLVWLTLNDLYTPRPLERPSEEFKVVKVLGSTRRNEYADNVEKLLGLLENEV